MKIECTCSDPRTVHTRILNCSWRIKCNIKWNVHQSHLKVPTQRKNGEGHTRILTSQLLLGYINRRTCMFEREPWEREQERCGVGRERERENNHLSFNTCSGWETSWEESARVCQGDRMYMLGTRTCTSSIRTPQPPRGSSSDPFGWMKHTSCPAACA